VSELLTAFTHPLVDRVEGGNACVESRADHVVLSESLADALLAVAAAGLRPVLITRPGARLSYLARYYLTLAGGQWLVREGASVLRDVLTGRVAETVEQAFGAERVLVAARPGDPVRFLVSVSTQSPADETTQLGEAAISLSAHLAGTTLACWGAHEPATLDWDRAAYTEASRAWMPGPVRWVIADADGKARFTTTVRRTKGGVEETTTGILLAPAGSAAELTALALDSLARLADDAAAPLFASVSMQQGPADLGYDAQPVPLVVPVAGLVGPRATRALAPDVEALRTEFGARTAGRPRTPSLVVGFGSTDEPPMDVAARFAQALGTDQITRLLTRNAGAA
jgi:hypothetical protein